MSIRVLKAKAQSRRLVAEKNSVAKMPVNLYYSPNKGLCCPTNPHEPNPSGGIYVPKNLLLKKVMEIIIDRLC